MMPTPTTAFAAMTPAPASTDPIYVHPGRVTAQAAADQYTTIVGSGAVVCLWDPLGNVGGMAHFLLPECGNAPAATRFGDVALASLLNDLSKLGSEPRRLRAAVFGGSAPPLTSEAGHLGDRNIESALAFLRKHAIPILQRDVGGLGARKILFSARQGRAEVSRIGPA